MPTSRTKCVPKSLDPARTTLDHCEGPDYDAAQERLWGPATIQIDPRLIVDGPAGTVTASIMVSEFWTGNVIALECGAPARFPDDLAASLAWLVERCTHFAGTVSPF
jgi:hypothetical protein